MATRTRVLREFKRCAARRYGEVGLSHNESAERAGPAPTYASDIERNLGQPRIRVVEVSINPHREV